MLANPERNAGDQVPLHTGRVVTYLPCNGRPVGISQWRGRGRLFKNPANMCFSAVAVEYDGLQNRARKKGRTKRWLVRFPRAVPVGIFLLISAITILSVFAIERGEAQRQQSQMQSQGQAIASALERRANASAAYLRAGAALVATLDDLDLTLFRRFVSELRLDADYRGAEGIGWAMVVRPGEEAQFTDVVQRAGAATPRLRPALTPDRPFAVPVTFLQPDTERNRRALGFDMYSEARRREAMNLAAANARPTATGKVVLVQEGTGGEAPGFLIYMPVYEAAAGGRRLRGFIYSPFNAEDFLASALELEAAGQYGVKLFDQSRGEDSLLASTFVDGGQDRDTVIESVLIANTPFTVEVSLVEDGGLSGLSMATLIFGLLVASLLMLVVRILTHQAREDEASIEWFEEQASIRNSLTRELNHRVKNTLANVLSIIALTRRRAKCLEEFADGLDGRVRALSATHDLLTKSDWGTTPLRSVIEAELNPYANGGDHELEILGADIQLAPNDALSLGLAIHELATNASKYGALSQPGGKVTVKWEPVSERLVRVNWIETGGPAVAQDRSRGFGTDLIERIVAHELRNPVKLNFAPEGVTCELFISIREPTEFAMRAAQAAGRRRAPVE